MTTEAKIKKALDVLVDEIRKDVFVDPQDATVEETLGIIISKYLDWDGERIKQTAEFAFEDANFSGVEINLE